MDIRELKSIIEALLFTWGDPLDIKDLSSILSIKENELSEIMDEIKDDFDYNRRGIRIIKVKDSYQLSTRSEHYEWIKKLSNPKLSRNLSNAALETLSIIAYRQPIIKSDIEAIVGRLERIARPILYGTTEVFLRTFGLESLAKLPPLEEIEEDINNIELEE